MLAAICIAIVVASLFGGILPLATLLTHTRLQLYLSLSAGAMLGAAFLHMMPEAVELGSPETLRWSAAGLLTIFFVERFFAFHHHEAPAIDGDPCPDHPHEHEHGRDLHSAGLIADDAPGASFGTKAVKLHWGAAAFGLTLHTLLGGVALASAVAADRSTLGDLGASTWGVFLATLIHKPADALTITSLMLRAGMKKNHAHWANFGFSLMVPIGVALFFAGAEISSDPLDTRAWTAVTLAFSAGSFLCIALSDLLPELHFHEHDRLKLSAALLAGVGIMWVAEIFHTGQ